MNLNQFNCSLILGAPLVFASVLNACVSSDTEDPEANSQATSSTATSSAAASSTGSGGSSTSTSSETNTTGGEPDCSAAPSISTPLITDFETYDGATEAAAWEFNFNGDEAGMGAVYAGPFELKDTTGDYSLGFVAGADGSTWALSAQNSMASDWGGGIGLWMGCLDASSYTGVQFMVKGSSPANSGEVSVGLDGEISVSVQFDLPADWTQMQVPFADFKNDAGDTTNGSGIIRMSFQAHMKYVQDSTGEWVPEPGAFEIAVDDLAFY